jgi:hypothetical protein
MLYQSQVPVTIEHAALLTVMHLAISKCQHASSLVVIDQNILMMGPTLVAGAAASNRVQR